MTEKTIKPIWALVAVLGVLPVAGFICAIVYHDWSMFLVSLAGVPLLVLAFAVIGLVLPFVWRLPVLLVGSVMLVIERLRLRKR